MPELNDKEMAEEYGFALAFLRHDPELKNLFERAVKKTWTSQKFVAQLKETKWFRHNSATMRQSMVLKYTDPATYNDRVQETRQKINDMSGQMLGMKLGGKQRQRLAVMAVNFGWTEEQVVNQIVDSVNMRKQFHRKNLGGDAALLRSQIRAAAQSFGVNPRDRWMADQMEHILTGNETIEGVTSQLQEWSARRYTAFADEIRGGKTVADIAEPYRQTMAELLEMNPDRIELDKGLVHKALTWSGKDKHGHRINMSLSDFADKVRSDERWLFTENAKEQANAVANDLMKSWGVLA